jgi:hypothetical protein
MKWLLVLAIILSSARQPTKVPQDKGTAKSNRTVDAGHTNPTQTNKQTSIKAAPISKQTLAPADGKEASIATTNATSKNSTQPPGEDLRIQRELAWFTGALVAVGILQTVVMFLTWLIYRRQAREMRRQRHEMRRQRHVMFRQWKSMGQQAVFMEGQLNEMKAAGGQAARQIAIAEENIKTIISKEQGRLRLKAINLKMPDESIPWALVEYQVRLYGPTDAIVRTTISDAIISDSEEPPSYIPLSSLSIPAIVSPSDSPFTQYQMVTPTENISEDFSAVNKGEKFVHFWGCILYGDVFGNHHYTNFRFVWYLMPGVTRDGNPVGRWDKCGPQRIIAQYNKFRTLPRFLFVLTLWANKW